MILLLGAGGQTGRRIARHAAVQGIPITLAGRDVRRLEAHAAGMPFRQVDVCDSASLAAGLAGIRVVINATTPAGQLAGHIAEACLREGVAYTDISGEVAAIVAMIGRLDAPAQRAGIPLVPGAGYGGALGDLTVRAALALRPDATDALVIYAGDAFVPSRGTQLSEAHVMDGPVPVLRDGKLTLDRTLIGRIWQAFGLTLVQRPTMDAVLIARHPGPLLRCEVGMAVPEAMAQAVSTMFRGIAERLASPAGRADYLAGIAAAPHEEVVEDEQAEYGTITAHVWGTDTTPRFVRYGTGPVYDMTARIALLIADTLATAPNLPVGVRAPSEILVRPFEVERVLSLRREDDHK
jgi:hypothetical protein